MSGDIPSQLESYTASLLNSLTARQGEIPWASSAISVYQVIQSLYGLFSSAKNVPDTGKELAQKVKDLEKYLTIDVERHITLKNANAPYHLAGTLALITKIRDSCSSNNNGGSFDNSKLVCRLFDHLAAELQAMFNEYGFCDTLDAIYHVDEATMKLDALSLKLSKVENQSNGIEPGVVIGTLHDVVATQSGIRQAMTQQNVDKMQNKFQQITSRLTKLENSFCSEHIKGDSTVFLEYLAQQFMLRKPFVQSMFNSVSEATVNDHMIHPGTRGWVLERISRWLHQTEKRVYYIGGKKGTGKTALSSAICKLHNYDIVASHFFNASLGNTTNNTLNGMIQAIASGMCSTMPEYINWLDDKYGSSDLSARLNVSWQESYNILLKEPLQDLYGHGSSASSHVKRKLIVIDGLDEMSAEDYKNFKTFTSAFMKDISNAFCMLITVRHKHFNELVHLDVETVDGVRFEDRAWVNRHIKDIEIYLSSSLGAILSGEDEVDAPQHAKADDTTLQNTVDELLKCSSGRFDFAIQLMETFAQEFSSSGQFLGSVKKSTMPVRQSIGSEYDQKMSDFASPYRAYRDKEGRSVVVRVMRQSQYLMDKTRVALIRGRHKIHDLNS